jgi:hypothetical protein
MDRETIEVLLDLLIPLHGSLDRQTYDEQMRSNFDAPGDAEYEVTITSQQERDLSQAVSILENRLRGQPRVIKDGTKTYAVIGSSGKRAGYIQRVGPKNGGMWELQLLSSPRAMIRLFKDAKVEAIEQAQRY